MHNSPIKPLPKGCAPTKEECIAGLTVLIDKPKTWTSFDVVNKIRVSLKYRMGIPKIKVGHAGTLDPLATGLLIICIGKHTKRIQELSGLPKTYEGTFFLGMTTPSYDAETQPDAHFPVDHIDEAALHRAKEQFMGRIEQFPPLYSAVKQDGQRLYKIARKGGQVEIKSRVVEITSFELTRIALPEVDFRVSCSKGTYIRSLAHDFGKALGSGAYLSELRRTATGDFSLEDAWDLEAFIEAMG